MEQHPHHEYVKDKIIEYQGNRDYEEVWYNRPPCKKSLLKDVQAKKATTDFPNELLKRGGEGFIDCLYSLIKHFWENETPPKEWNRGVISNVYKGKGDREKMQF